MNSSRRCNNSLLQRCDEHHSRRCGKCSDANGMCQSQRRKSLRLTISSDDFVASATFSSDDFSAPMFVIAATRCTQRVAAMNIFASQRK